jgi:hypothetical protein
MPFAESAIGWPASAGEFAVADAIVICGLIAMKSDAADVSDWLSVTVTVTLSGDLAWVVELPLNVNVLVLAPTAVPFICHWYVV